jgi:hypothetical protein
MQFGGWLLKKSRLLHQHSILFFLYFFWPLPQNRCAMLVVTAAAMAS